MPQDAVQTKEQILTFLRRRGPSLPVHIAKEINMNSLFTSAFLSELVSDKKIKMSNLRVGSSPVYFLPGQDASLERFAEHLKSKEKDAYTLLRERKFLHDKNLEPAIRIAIRAIKDFAIPFENSEELYWKYFTADQSEFTPKEPKEEDKIDEIAEIEKEIESKIEEVLEIPGGETLDIFEDKEEKPKKKIKERLTQKTKKQAKKKTAKKDDKFFDKIKEHLEKKGIEIIGIEGIGKTELIFKIKEGKEEKLLFAYNKKKIADSDLIKAFKKASNLDLAYKILSIGETSKKLSGLIEAAKSLEDIGKIE